MKNIIVLFFILVSLLSNARSKLKSKDLTLSVIPFMKVLDHFYEKETVLYFDYVITNNTDSIVIFNTLLVYEAFNSPSLFSFEFSEGVLNVSSAWSTACSLDQYLPPVLSHNDSLRYFIKLMPKDHYRTTMYSLSCWDENMLAAIEFRCGRVRRENIPKEVKMSVRLMYDTSVDTNQSLYRVKGVFKGKLVSDWVPFVYERNTIPIGLHGAKVTPTTR